MTPIFAPPDDEAAATGTIAWEDSNGALIANADAVRVGAGVTVTPQPDGSVLLEAQGGGSALSIQNHGSAVAVRPALDFEGAGVVLSDDVANNRTVVTVPGTSGPGGNVVAPADAGRPDALSAWNPVTGEYEGASYTQGIPKHPRLVTPPRQASTTVYFDATLLGTATGNTSAASVDTGGFNPSSSTWATPANVYGPNGSVKFTAPASPGTVTITFDLGSPMNFLQDPAARMGVAGPSPSHYMRLWLRTDDERIGDRQAVGSLNVDVSNTVGFTKFARLDMNQSGEAGFMTQMNEWIPISIPMHNQFQANEGNGNVWGANPANSPDWTAIRYIRFTLVSKNPANTAFPYRRSSYWLGAFEMVPVPPFPVFSLHYDWATHDQYVTHGLLAKYGVYPTVWIYPQILERIAAGDPAGGPSSNMKAQQLLQLVERGWETGLYEYWQAFIDGGGNFGLNQSGSTTPWLNRSKVSVVEAFERGQYTMAQFGLKGWDLMGGQPRKFVNVTGDPFPSGFDMIRRYFSYVRGPSTNEVPQYWPPDFPMHCMQRMFTTGTGPTDPVNDTFNSFARLKQTLQRALYGHEWLTYLIHTPPGTLESILQIITQPGWFDGQNGRLIRTGDVLDGKVS